MLRVDHLVIRNYSLPLHFFGFSDFREEKFQKRKYSMVQKFLNFLAKSSFHDQFRVVEIC